MQGNVSIRIIENKAVIAGCGIYCEAALKNTTNQERGSI